LRKIKLKNKKNMKNKNTKKYIIFILLFSLLFSFVQAPKQVSASSLADAKDTLSTSHRGSIATHTINFKTNTTTPTGGSFDVELDANFGDIVAVGNISCSTGTPTWVSTEVARCLLTNNVPASTSSITITGVANPLPAFETPTSYFVYLRSYSVVGGAVLERSDVKVAIIDHVVVSAKVTATLVFTISNVPTSTVINGQTMTNFGATSSLNFNTLVPNATSSLGQRLNVTTNADDGYTVTVEQDHELLSNSSSTINSFNNSPDYTGSTTPTGWADPTGILDAYYTYGHMGLTTNDSDLSSLSGYANSDFTGGKFAGLNWTNPKPIMHHNGPSDGTTQNAGVAMVAYAVKITALQEAGDYTNILTYICTPTY
jgi:hypothetical protein